MTNANHIFQANRLSTDVASVMVRPVITNFDLVEGVLSVVVEVANLPVTVQLFHNDFYGEIGSINADSDTGMVLVFTVPDRFGGTFIARVTDCYGNSVSSEPYLVPLPPAPAPTETVAATEDGINRVEWVWDFQESGIGSFRIKLCDSDGNLIDTPDYDADPSARSVIIGPFDPGLYYFVVFAMGNGDGSGFYAAGLSEPGPIAMLEVLE